jgi:hypothetical protein
MDDMLTENGGKKITTVNRTQEMDDSVLSHTKTANNE